MTTEISQQQVKKVIQNIEKVIIGKTEVARLSIVALLAEGHVLLEDVPGLGKTMLVKALAKSVDADFKRIQFTPDLLPSDVLGVSIYNPKEMAFSFRPGPIVGNIVLADEINRTSPKTQSALLEAMEEKSVTIDGATLHMEKPFFVMATQNPVEYEGTYPLPEAQLDRFLLKLKMGYPEANEEVELLTRVQKVPPIDYLEPVISLEELRHLQRQVKDIFAEETIKQYIVDLAIKTRSHPDIFLGISPRGSIALLKAAQAYAFISGRDFIIPDDVQYLAPYVFSHRILLQSEAKYRGVSAESLIGELVKSVDIPVKRAVK
ncbi:MoxR family ATPase [Siminovitchia sp. FSL H7-0308]|uniref:MoxR-like ATPase n=1 Tax=Siminovitchia thermophila TaxID=1245522 RepID=A0ABS2R6X8_9BACI|nr:MoxR family ATPase [Siminovitchia thermophila]MBM7714346.1 MoxR-like ATPase [Siminovitchia thermophila]ONK22242.1 AAA family ATPase [Bacillus sp. VT-16-64]